MVLFMAALLIWEVELVVFLASFIPGAKLEFSRWSGDGVEFLNTAFSHC